MKEFKDPNHPMHSVDGSKCPIFFVYGSSKCIMFHDEKWLEMMDANKEKGCFWKELDSGHWVMNDKAEELNKLLLDWLKDTDIK